MAGPLAKRSGYLAMDMTGRPAPRARGGSPLRVSWFELFYDLVIVASFAHTGHLIVNDLSGDRLTMVLGVWLVSTFLVTFALWFATSTAVNIAPGTVTLRKTLMFVQMFAVTVANLALSRSDGLPDDWGFAGLSMAFGTVMAIYAITGQRRPELKAAVSPWIWSSAAAVIVLAVGIVIPDEWENAEIVAFGLASALAIVPILLVGIPRLCRMNLVEPEHLAERVGQLVIIVIGESFLGLVLALSGFDYVPGPIFFILTFLVAGSLWAIYFSSVYPMGIPLTPGRLELWLLGVVVFLIGVSYIAEMLAAYSVVEWAQQSITRSFVPLAALYCLVGALLLGWIGGAARDIAYARIHLAAIGLLGILWIGLVLIGSPANLLLLAAALTVVADGLACIALQRRMSDREITTAD